MIKQICMCTMAHAAQLIPHFSFLFSHFSADFREKYVIRSEVKKTPKLQECRGNVVSLQRESRN